MTTAVPLFLGLSSTLYLLPITIILPPLRSLHVLSWHTAYDSYLFIFILPMSIAMIAMMAMML